MLIVKKETNYTLDLPTPIVLEEKVVRMGETRVDKSYELTQVRVVVSDSGYCTAIVRGFELTKTGKRKKRSADAMAEYVPVVAVITMHEDGTSTFDESAYRAIEQEAIDLVKFEEGIA